MQAKISSSAHQVASETMDRPALLEYEKVAKGGTPLAAIATMGCSQATLEFGRTLSDEKSGSLTLKEKFNTAHHRLGIPVSIEETDRFFTLLSSLSGRSVPEKYTKERGRLIDAYVDGHKYLFGKKAIIYGEEDLVVGLTAFLAEIGIFPGVSCILATAVLSSFLIRWLMRLSLGYSYM